MITFMIACALSLIISHGSNALDDTAGKRKPYVYVCKHIEDIKYFPRIMFPEREVKFLDVGRERIEPLEDDIIMTRSCFTGKFHMTYWENYTDFCLSSQPSHRTNIKDNVDTKNYGYDNVSEIDRKDHLSCIPHVIDFPGTTFIFETEFRVAPQVMNERFVFFGVGYNERENSHRTLAGGDMALFPYAIQAMLIPGLTERFLEVVSSEQQGVRENKDKFLSYTQSHCVSYREEAFMELYEYYERAQLEQQQTNRTTHRISKYLQSVIHCGGTCCGRLESVDYGGITTRSYSSDQFRSNTSIVPSPYRFSLVMENRDTFDSMLYGYVTEKILTAFLRKEIPIYYGPPEVTQFFNPKAFIWYDSVNQTHLDIIRELETNSTKYWEMYHQPMITRAQLEHYWSVGPDMFGGRVNKHIRHILHKTT